VLGGNPVMEDGLWWSCQRKERKERVKEQQKKERVERAEEDSSLHLGPESEPGKSCCCPLLFRL
jgi:hypothetical protein